MCRLGLSLRQMKAGAMESATASYQDISLKACGLLLQIGVWRVNSLRGSTAQRFADEATMPG